MSSLLNQGENEEVADELSDNSSRFPKDGFPQLCEQGNFICRINDIMMYARGKTYALKHLVERCARNMGLGSMIKVRMVIQ